MPRRYAKPPVTQAICEFQFVSDKVWDWTIPGLIYQKISNEFPVKQQEQAFQLSFTPQVQQRPVQQFSAALSKMEFVKSDKSAMVQIGPDLLAINVQNTYPGWPSFSQLISDQFQTYLQTASPKGFKRIGVRYINQIQFMTGAIEITKYFQYYPHLPESIEQKHGPFSMRVMHSYNDEKDALVITVANLVTPANIVPTAESVSSGHLSYVLDLDYSLIQSAKIQLDEGLKWVEAAHTNIEAMFEACITDELRALFEEKQ